MQKAYFSLYVERGFHGSMQFEAGGFDYKPLIDLAHQQKGNWRLERHQAEVLPGVSIAYSLIPGINDHAGR